jgi:hypothetical protein
LFTVAHPIPLQEETFREHYDHSTEMWQLLLRGFQYMECMVPGGRSKASLFWSSHMRFFRQMLISAKVPSLATQVKQAVNEMNRCVVIGLQSTGESNIAQVTKAPLCSLISSLSISSTLCSLSPPSLSSLPGVVRGPRRARIWRRTKSWTTLCPHPRWCALG